MKLKDPRITINNTDSGEWQLTADGLVSANEGLETVSFTVLLPRSQDSLPALTRQGVKKAMELLQGYLDHAPNQ